MIQFYAPLKHHKTKCFRDIKGKHRPETGSQQIYSEIKYILKNFAGFIGKHLCWSLFLIKLQLY